MINENHRYRLVVSAVNLVEGGTLRVLQEFVSAASSTLGSEWEIVALVNKRSLINSGRAKLITLPQIKKSWLARLYFEWIASAGISKRLDADVWVSLHDITSRVKARRKAVYCHNATPFYRASLGEAKHDVKFWLFSKLYGYLYGFGIHSNDFVIVQQDWIRRAFSNRFGVKNILVAYPAGMQVSSESRRTAGEINFIYPALARPFKNFEVICEAAQIVAKKTNRKFKVLLTIDKGENSYADFIVGKYGNSDCLNFIGRQSFAQMRELYGSSNCLIFPSRLETWGLPISEAKSYGLDMFVAEEPYAHETVGNYNNVTFFPTDDADKLAEVMIEYIEGKHVFEGAVVAPPTAPFVEGWDKLIFELCGDLKK